MDANEKRRIIEALVLASPEPISAARLADLIPYCTPAQAKDLINELNTEYQEQDRSFEIWEVAGGYQIRTRAEFSGYLQKLRKTRPMRLSRAALEGLAIIAYKQPVTRAEIDDVRGVDTGAVVKSLLERRLVRIVGHREVPGRPMLYGTSRRFLEVFGLKALGDLPELRELEELAREHGLGGPGDEDGAEDGEAGAPITELAEGEGPDAAAVAADLGVREIGAVGLAPEAGVVSNASDSDAFEAEDDLTSDDEDLDLDFDDERVVDLDADDDSDDDIDYGDDLDDEAAQLDGDAAELEDDEDAQA